MTRGLSALVTLALFWGCSSRPPTPTVPLLDNLGSHHYTVSTSAPSAQQYFDQGLRLYYGFNHAEAIRAFEEATRQDPDSAMGYWGIALAYGPNINAPMGREAALAAYDAVQKARAREAGATAKERALIAALAARYAAEPPEDRTALDTAYARELGAVARQFPDDLDVATLHAEALMDLSPWNYWTPEGEPRPDTTVILAELERVLAANPDHPGANHFYIHAVEAVQPQRAVAAAERLAALMPGAGHIVHMPGHIYIRVGRYQDAIAANEHAVHADETYIRDHQPAFGMYTAGYYPHNYDFLAFAASMVGRREQATTAAEKMLAIVPSEALREPGMSFMQHHLTRHLQVKVRFSRWDDILAAQPPAADLPHAHAMWQYARGRALAAQGNLKEAEAALEHVRAAAADPARASDRLEFNMSAAVLAIAREVLAGQVAAARRDFTRAVTHMEEAARLESSLTYGEPPEWTVPVRQELGMLLLAAGRNADAERAFREDLERFPNNGWSLRGVELALRAQGRTAQAEQVKAQVTEAWATADVEPPAHPR